MSIRWHIKWCHRSRITTPWHARLFHWISMNCRLVRASKENQKFQNWSFLTKNCGRYMAEILPIRRKPLTNQSIYQWTSWCKIQIRGPWATLLTWKKQFKSINTYDYIIMLIMEKKPITVLPRYIANICSGQILALKLGWQYNEV